MVLIDSDVRKEIADLVDEIIKAAPTHKIYLFGSFAYGKPGLDSDIDLCIITKDSNMRKRDLIKAIRKSISGVAAMPVDIIVLDKEEFSKRAKVRSTLEFKIANEGVSIYG